MPTNPSIRRTSARPHIGARALAGAAGGVYGAAAMSILRLGAHRMGLIDKMTPQVVEEWLADRLGFSPPGGLAGHHVADQLLHLGYGACLGALGSQVFAGNARGGLWRGAAFGLAVWAVGTLALLPGLGVARSAVRSTVGENAVNVAAHLLFGLSIQLLMEEPMRQPDHRRSADLERAATRVG